MIDDAELSTLLRYVSGESSPEEARAVRARLERDPEFRAQIEAWRRVREARPAAWHTEQALAALRRELRFGAARMPVRLVPFPKRAISARRRAAAYAMRVAAVLVIGAGIAGVWRMNRTPRTVGGVPVAAELREYTTPRGRWASVRLTDGTEVTLAAETRLVVPRHFGAPGAWREVRLEGQAYFNVVHDETRPFVVRTATSITEDIGTAFAVRAYPMEPEVEVVVAEGVVAVRPAHAAVDAAAGKDVRQILTRGQVARLDAKGELQTEHDVDLASHLAWTKGSLAFDGVPFRRAARDLERWYDLDIQIADSALGTRRVHGTINGGESVDAVLRYLALVLDARYELRGRLVTFASRRPPP